MPSLNWKAEAGSAACMRFWTSQKERYQSEGQASAAGESCPYHPRSFAALHWHRGASQRSERSE